RYYSKSVFMYKKYLLSLFIFLTSFLHAEIIEIEQIDSMRPFIIKGSFCLFDVDDTQIQNPFSLGRPAWRNWAKPLCISFPTDFVLFDALTLFIAKKAPYQPVEGQIVKLISDLQNEGITTFAFTARGRSEWYSSYIEGVDQFTYKQLKDVGMDFK